MKKTIAVILALITLSLLIAGCAPKTGVQEEAATINELGQEVQDVDSIIDSDLQDLDSLDQELAEIEALDLG
jgi:outer membrane murein-binding lipoprotein Lpp